VLVADSFRWVLGNIMVSEATDNEHHSTAERLACLASMHPWFRIQPNRSDGGKKSGGLAAASHELKRCKSASPGFRLHCAVSFIDSSLAGKVAVEQTGLNFEKHIVIDEASRLAVDVLAEATGLSKQCVKHAMKKGAVWVTPAAAGEKRADVNAGEENLGEEAFDEETPAVEKSVAGKKTQRLRRAKKILQPGDILHLYYHEKILAEQPPAPELFADEGAYSVWYKPYGLRSQGSKWSDHCTICRWVEMHLEPQRPAFSVHRLDRAATGLMIIAHKKSTAVEFSRMFAKREIEKRYRVVVQGQFPHTPEPLSMSQDIDERAAISHAMWLEYDATQDRSLLEVRIESGRKHQIRRHLAQAGFPVVGDRLYGNASDAENENLQLTACYLAFNRPGSGAAESPWGQRVDNKQEYRLDDKRVVSLSAGSENENA